MLEIRTTALPSFEQTLTLDGVPFRLRLRWNARAQAWFLDLSTPERVAIVSGVRIVTGIPLLARYGQRADLPAGHLVAADTSGAGEDPTYDDFGTRVRLFYAAAADLP